jgi:hypothetical protein
MSNSRTYVDGEPFSGVTGRTSAILTGRNQPTRMEY